MSVKLANSIEPEKTYLLGIYDTNLDYAFDCYIYLIKGYQAQNAVTLILELKRIRKPYLLSNMYKLLGKYPVKYFRNQGLVLNSEHPYAIWEI